VLSLLRALGLGLFSDPLLRLFGPEFVRAEPAFRILLISVCLLSAFGPAGSFLSMTGKAHVNAWTAVGTMPVAALLMALLIPQFGAMGAALATSAALSLRVLIQLAIMRQVLRDLKHRAEGI
jgi:O-antigen/teichoic acid export membrane protein